MARRKNAMMKFVLPTALALGKRAVTRWPLAVAAVGGALAYGLVSRRRTGALSRRMGAWAATDAKPKRDTVMAPEPVAPPTIATNPDAWSPTIPTVAW